MSKRKDETGDAVKDILGEQAESGSESPSQDADVADGTPGTPRGAKRQVSAYLTPANVARLAEIAEAKDRSLAYIVREAVQEYIDRAD